MTRTPISTDPSTTHTFPCTQAPPPPPLPSTRMPRPAAASLLLVACWAALLAGPPPTEASCATPADLEVTDIDCIVVDPATATTITVKFEDANLNLGFWVLSDRCAKHPRGPITTSPTSDMARARPFLLPSPPRPPSRQSRPSFGASPQYNYQFSYIQSAESADQPHLRALHYPGRRGALGHDPPDCFG